MRDSLMRDSLMRDRVCMPGSATPDIATASAEQSSGIDQVNIAPAQMDEVTQQSSALVEQNAAAAKALEQQSQAMDERVSLFRADEAAPATDAPRVVAIASRRPAAASARASTARSPTSA